MLNRLRSIIFPILPVLAVMLACAESAPESEVAASAEPDPTREAIDDWLIGWSTAQASSVQESCEQDPGCDPSQYAPEARPETTFGWDGAESVEPTADWARGPRYWVQANGRRVLLYLEGNRITGAYTEPDGMRTNLCRDDECYPS